MKTITPSFLRKGMLFYCVALSTLLFYNCSTKDMEYISPYEFVNDEFEQIPDQPVVVDEDPVIIEPETGSVENSAVTQSVVADVLDVEEDGSISENTREVLQDVDDFTTQLPAAVNTAAQNLTQEGIDNILDADQDLPADLEAARDALENAPANIKALMPVLVLSTDLEDLMGVDLRTGYGRASFDPAKADLQSQTVTGPCADAAYDAYDVAMADITAQYEANMFIIESNYARRMDEAESRYASRLEAQIQRYAEVKAGLSDVLTDLLEAAAEAESLGETELAAQLRQLTLLYAIDARATLIEWNNLVLELLQVTKEQEEAQALLRRETLTAQATAAFDEAKAQAQTILNQSLNNCHNQGSGN